MKKVFLFIIVVIMCLSLTSIAVALSDPEYLQMKRDSPEYAMAEAKLQKVWNELKSSMSKSAYSYLLDEQREWIGRGRDEAASGYIYKGYSRIEAYTMATIDRANYLPTRAKALENSNISNKNSAARKFLGVQ